MLAVDVMSDRGNALLRTFRAAFEALAEHAKRHPGEAVEIAGSCAAHVRSASPMALAEMPPEPDPVAEISRDIADGGRYTLLANTDSITLTLVDLDGDRAVGTLTAIEIFRLRSDVACVGAAMGGKR